MNKNSEPQGPSALVTGGLRGIGLGIVQSLRLNGYKVLIADLDNPDEIDPSLKESEDIYYVRTDIADAKSRENLVLETERIFGSPDVLVNNAGVAPKERKDILLTDEGGFQDVLKINLQGPFFLTQRIAELMILHKRQYEQPFRCIVNISSSNAVAVATDRASYCISKIGVSMATKLWAVRLAEYGILVYEILPGLIKTRMTEVVQKKYDSLIDNGFVPLNRWGYPEDIGRVVAMLAKGDMRYSTGEQIHVDGGQLLQRF